MNMAGGTITVPPAYRYILAIMEVDSPREGKSHGLAVHWILLFSVAVAVIASGYKYFVAEDYSFFVEAPCDPVTHTCYIRDCEEEECPPNEFSLYRVFVVPARVFPFCSDNTCMNICDLRDEPCEEILCSPDAGATCEGPLSLL